MSTDTPSESPQTKLGASEPWTEEAKPDASMAIHVDTYHSGELELGAGKEISDSIEHSNGKATVEVTPSYSAMDPHNWAT